VEREEGHAMVGEGSKVRRSVSDCRLGVRSKKEDEW
jgi:hypothetical protein